MICKSGELEGHGGFFTMPLSSHYFHIALLPPYVLRHPPFNKVPNKDWDSDLFVRWMKQKQKNSQCHLFCQFILAVRAESLTWPMFKIFAPPLVSPAWILGGYTPKFYHLSPDCELDLARSQLFWKRRNPTLICWYSLVPSINASFVYSFTPYTFFSFSTFVLASKRSISPFIWGYQMRMGVVRWTKNSINSYRTRFRDSSFVLV